MKYNTFVNTVSILFKLNRERMRYLNSLPEDIRAAITENEFITKIELMFNVLAKEFFGLFSYEIMEFIYSGYIRIGQKEIDTLDDFLEYAKSRYSFEDEDL